MNWRSALWILGQAKDVAQYIGGSVGTDDVLRMVNLQRRRSFFESALPAVGYFAAGIVAGAGLGLLLAPYSGKQLRDNLGNRVNQLKEKTSSAAGYYQGPQRMPGTMPESQPAGSHPDLV